MCSGNAAFLLGIVITWWYPILLFPLSLQTFPIWNAHVFITYGLLVMLGFVYPSIAGPLLAVCLLLWGSNGSFLIDHFMSLCITGIVVCAQTRMITVVWNLILLSHRLRLNHSNIKHVNYF